MVALKVLAQYSCTEFGIGMHVYITFEVRYLYCILSCLQSTTYNEYTHMHTLCVPPEFQAALFFFYMWLTPLPFSKVKKREKENLMGTQP